MTIDNIQVKIEIDEALPPVQSQKARLAEVLFNLLDNARDAIAAKRQVTGDELADEKVTIRTYVENQWVCAEVADTGIGIADHLKDRIFEPFFSTKNTNRAKGLGLAVCHQVVQAYRGRIIVKSAEGKGTTIILCFPAAAPGDQ